MGDEIAGYVDVALVFKSQTTLEVFEESSVTRLVVRRYAQTYPDPQHPWVRDNSGQLPPEFPINFEDDFERLHAAVFGSVSSLPPSAVVQQLDEKAVAETRAAAVATTIPESAPLSQPTPDEVEKAPAPVPVAPKPAPAPAPEAESAAAAAIAAELSAPTNGAPAKATVPACEECGGPIESEDQLDLSILRFRRPLCRTCFINQKQVAGKAR
jgi:hypothetical protein